MRIPRGFGRGNFCGRHRKISRGVRWLHGRNSEFAHRRHCRGTAGRDFASGRFEIDELRDGGDSACPRYGIIRPDGHTFSCGRVRAVGTCDGEIPRRVHHISGGDREPVVGLQISHGGLLHPPRHSDNERAVRDAGALDLAVIHARRFLPLDGSVADVIFVETRKVLILLDRLRR